MSDTPTNRLPSSLPTLSPELRARLISGFALAAVALVVDYLGHAPFALLVIVLAVGMAWEWGRLVRSIDIDAAHVVHAVTVAAGAALAALGLAALGLIVLAIGTIAIVPLRLGERAPLSALGVLYVGLPAVSLLWLRGDPGYGFYAILLIFVVVWSTDTAAYVVGRSLGGPRLWPSVSPNKTWSGLIGGVAAAAVAAPLVMAIVMPAAEAPRVAATATLLAVFSQGGDLAESALKRSFGVKDAGHLIPGHGGLMDRLDGLVAAATLAALLGLALNVHAPARALLFWG